MRRLWRPYKQLPYFPRYEEDHRHLPLSHSNKWRRHSRVAACRQLLTFRRIRIVFTLILTLFIFQILSSGIPSTYEDVRLYERQLPQHNISQALAHGTRYLRIPERLWGHGLNNILQETIVSTHLAHKVGRSFVFEDYIWSKLPFPFTIYDFALRPTRLPVNAFASGPIAGGSAHEPSAISAEFWETVCPPERRYIISSADQPRDSEGDVLLDWWVQKINSVNDTCVEIDAVPHIVFDFMLFGCSRVLSLWEGLSKSPVLTEFAWSPLVQSAISRNAALFQPINSAQSISDITSRAQIPGLVAVHLRRGDFSRHCHRLEKYRSTFMGFAQFPEFLDKFDPWKYEDYDERKKYYLDHCLPSVAQVAQKLWTVRTAHPELKRVYVMTNGQGSWLRELRTTLLYDGWEDVKSSVDMQFDIVQKHIHMAVDMAIAEKAEVFVGNGFSSLSSNIMMLRMAKGLDASTNRLL